MFNVAAGDILELLEFLTKVLDELAVLGEILLKEILGFLISNNFVSE